MIVEVADHPFILACEFEVCLPEAVAMLPLESTLAPNLSRRGDWIVQASLDEDSMNGSVADGRDSLDSSFAGNPRSCSVPNVCCVSVPG